MQIPKIIPRFEATPESTAIDPPFTAIPLEMTLKPATLPTEIALLRLLKALVAYALPDPPGNDADATKSTEPNLIDKKLNASGFLTPRTLKIKARSILLAPLNSFIVLSNDMVI